jgi:hypothetical protein
LSSKTKFRVPSQQELSLEAEKQQQKLKETQTATEYYFF